MHSDPRYGNSIMYFETAPPPKGGMLYFGAAYTVRRREAGAIPAPRPDDTVFLKPERLVPTSGRILELARQVTQGKTSDLEKARAIYDFVTSYMTYDKTAAGWGRGDALRACEVRKGNCTDFHALLIGMARAAGIPARFKIGFPLPADAQSGEVAGYHCWAELYIDGMVWLPVDSSEAFKHPELKDYYFGKLDANRVELTTGRDLLLSPAQAGPRLNYFIYPYVEVDGKPYSAVKHAFRFDPVTQTAATNSDPDS